MAIQISVETLSPITHNQIPVITTELLSKLYGCSVECIHRNHHRNKDRFAEGKHYIIAKGADLQNLKISLRDFQTIAPNVRKIILWTERGAARHAKMLETDQAWDVFEKLEDCYFSQERPPAVANVGLSEDCDYLLSIRNGKLEMRPLESDELVGPPEKYLEEFRRLGWLVVQRELLVERLMQL